MSNLGEFYEKAFDEGFLKYPFNLVHFGVSPLKFATCIIDT